jgi:DNA-binding NarL/FixJ family response regulator
MPTGIAGIYGRQEDVNDLCVPIVFLLNGLKSKIGTSDGGKNGGHAARVGPGSSLLNLPAGAGRHYVIRDAWQRLRPEAGPQIARETAMTQTTTENMKAKVSILLVDDHAVVRFGLSSIINRQDDMVVCGEEESASRGLTAIEALQPDLLVADISLKDSSGLELMRNVKAQYPKLPMLVVSAHDESVYAEIAFRAGALGYLMKSEGIEKIITAIRRVMSGSIYVSEALAAKMLQKQIRGKTDAIASPADSLSDRELEVFQLIGQWKGTRQIADELHLSVKTIEYYREQIKRKLGLKNANGLSQAATAWVEKEMFAVSQ